MITQDQLDQLRLIFKDDYIDTEWMLDHCTLSYNDKNKCDVTLVIEDMNEQEIGFLFEGK